MEQGHNILAYDVWAPSLDRFRASGGHCAESVEACAVKSNVLVLMVVNADQAIDVLTTKGALRGQ